MNGDRELRFLFVEDSLRDVELCKRELKRGGFSFTARHVDSADAVEAAVAEDWPDLILCDFTLAGALDGFRVLEIARLSLRETPFVLVSGTIGEELAVEALKRGASDYVLKDNLRRLVPVVRRALRESEERAGRRLAEAENQRQRDFLRQVIDVAPLLIYARDRFGRFILANRALADQYGSSVEEITGKTPGELGWRRAEHDLHANLELQVMETLREESLPEEALSGPDGGTRYLHTIKRPILITEGRAGAALTVSMDITQRKLHERKIAKLTRLRLVAGATNAAIIRIREPHALLNETCRIANDVGGFEMVWAVMLDSGAQQVLPVSFTGFPAETARQVSWEDAWTREGALSRAISSGKVAVANELSTESAPGPLLKEAARRGYHSAAGLPLTMHGATVAAIGLYAAERDFFDEDEIALLVELASNISLALNAHAQQERVEFLSYYDALTGLPNRRLFVDRLSQQMWQRESETPTVALVMLDIERFRNINESLGYHAGDEVLKQTAARLEERFRGKSRLARVGADSFGVVLRGMLDAADIARIVEGEIHACFADPFVILGKEWFVTARTGIALFPADGSEPDVVFRNAEKALENAKHSGDSYLFYSTAMKTQANHELALETRLRHAITARQFVLYYQPRFELATGRLCGLEALIRWHEPESGLVPPAAFIPLLEETGLIRVVGQWVLSQVLDDYRDWAGRGLSPPRIAINVSAVQLQQKEFVEIVTAAARQAGGLAHALDIEITESLVMKDVEASVRKLRALREQGIRIAIDDFGTGYSSLSYISRLPVDMIKIDRSFVDKMTLESYEMAIVTTVIALAHSLKLKVVAEGVENDEQARLLRRLACDEVQGYLYGRPLPRTEIDSVLAAHVGREATAPGTPTGCGRSS